MYRLNRALLHTIAALGFHGSVRSGRFGVWGRTGQLAACGVSVKHDVACHGAFLNVNPPMDIVRMVDAEPSRIGESRRSRSMGCLVAEHGRPVRMTKVRSTLIEQLALQLDCHQYHLHTGHPLLASLRNYDGDPRALAS
jgi:lipoate-protein ligase B